MKAARWAGLALVAGCRVHAPLAVPDPGSMPTAITSRADDGAAAIAVPVAAHADTAEDVRALTLAEVVEVAWENAAGVLAAKAELEIQEARARRVAQDALPTADVGVGLRYFAGRQQSNFGATQDANYPRFDPALVLRYRVNPAAAAQRYDAAERVADVAVADIAQARRVATREAALAYHDLLMARAAMDVSAMLVADGERFLEIAEARARSGVASEADAVLATVELAAARGVEAEAEGQWRVASAELATLLMLPASVTLVPAQDAVRPRSWVDAAPSALEAEAGRARPDLEVARREITAADEAHKARRLEIAAPDVLLEARGYLLTDFSSFGPGSLLTGLVGWSFAFGEIGAAREARARTAARKTNLRAAERRAAGEVRVAAARADASRASIQHARDGLVAAEHHQRIEVARFEAGTALGLQVIQAQNSVARARLGLAESVIRYNANQIELLAAVGHLDPKTVSAASGASAPAQPKTVAPAQPVEPKLVAPDEPKPAPPTQSAEPTSAPTGS